MATEPLSQNNPSREKTHTRNITLNGYRRSDGLMDIEAEMTDVKTYPFPNRLRGIIEPGQPFHHMKLRIAIDENLLIHEAEAETLAGPYAACPGATAPFANLIGLTIGPGWRRKLREAIGGRQGCTHITELMGPVATVAYQTLYGEKVRQERQQQPDSKASSSGETRNEINTNMINSCLAYHQDGEIVRHLWPDGVPTEHDDT